MIELITSYSFSNVPYITEEELDAYAMELISDFAPNLLSSPEIVDVDGFIEFYLGLITEYHRISLDRKVLGITAFNDGLLDVANELTGATESIPVRAGTIVIDTSLTTKRSSLPRLRFTMMHEGAHWLLHRKAFDRNNPMGPVGVYTNQFLAAKEGKHDYNPSRKEHTDIQRMERQADFLTSAVLMPLPALRKVFKDFFKLHGDKPRRIIRGTSPLDDFYARRLPEVTACLFGVSKQAATIRLEKLTAIVDGRSWRGYL